MLRHHASLWPSAGTTRTCGRGRRKPRNKEAPITQRRSSRLVRFARLAAIIFVAVIGLAIILAVVGSIIDTAEDETTALATAIASPTSSATSTATDLTPASVPTPAPAASVATPTPSTSAPLSQPSEETVVLAAPNVAHLTPDEFEEAAVIHGVTAHNIGELKYWQEAWVHRDELDSIDEYTSNVFADGVMDLNESIAVCSVLPQWLGFIETTETYLEDYEAFAPEQLAGHHAALNLEPETQRIHSALAETITACASAGF